MTSCSTFLGTFFCHFWARLHPLSHPPQPNRALPSRTEFCDKTSPQGRTLPYCTGSYRFPGADYRRFHRVHAPGLKLTSGLCLFFSLASDANYKCIRWWVDWSWAQVVVLWNAMFPIHWFICGGSPQYQNWPSQIDFPKGFDFVE